jgi:superfamily II DNA or RNA helicase
MRFPKQIALWPHQAKAVTVVSSFLDREAGTKQPRGRPSALVNIPTGGGKTAVIGVLSHWHPKLKCVLVASPRTAIRDQLALELAARRGFFLRCGLQETSLPKSVISLHSAADFTRKFPENTILVSTIQLINDLARDRVNNRAYDRLAKVCDAVIVDEGHYEPAYVWSQALRNLGRPIILVTATPYRNDLKPFELDPAAIHVSQYSELMSEHVLRKVDVVRASPTLMPDPKDFVNSVLDEFVSYYGAATSRERKLIIRCKSKEQIEQIGDHIRKHRYGKGDVLCLHERFASNPARSCELRQPIDPEGATAPAIWVHQYKLLEGVDGPSFRAVAFYGVVGSARALIQQVGRVIRNPQKDERENALLIEHTDGVIEDMWSRFLEYDATIDPARMLKGLAEFARDYEAALPPVVYVDRQFRRRFGFGHSDEEIIRSLRLPLRCHLHSAEGANFARLRKAMEDRLIEAEYPFQTIVANKNELLVLFVKIESSPLLSEHYFMERELHAFVASRKGPVIALLDTSRSGLDRECLRYLGRQLGRQQIARLLASSPDTRLVEVNARNAALGPSSVRKRSASAPSLVETPPALDEFQFVASSITAVNRSRSSDATETEEEDGFSIRSVGFGLARVTDASIRRTLEDWYDWTERLGAAAVDGSRAAPAYLDRFARQLDRPPERPWPRNILLDLDEARALFVPVSGPGDGLEIEDTCVDCRRVADDTAPRAIEVTANGMPCAGTVVFDQANQTYELESDDLARRYRHVDGTRVGSIVDHLNANQAFVVIPDAADAIYAEGDFFDPRLGLGRHFDPNALGLDTMLVTRPLLRACNSEKGGPNSATAAGWANNTVFHWIDRHLDEILPNADLVICDDGTHESCDFLLVGRRDRRDICVVIHAKACRDPSFVSASALHEVCSQTAKQVGLLAQFGTVAPPQVALWSGAWVGSRAEGQVARRIRRQRGSWARLTGGEIWHKLQAMLAGQGTEREVALVLGAALDRDQLFMQARR